MINMNPPGRRCAPDREVSRFAWSVVAGAVLVLASCRPSVPAASRGAETAAVQPAQATDTSALSTSTEASSAGTGTAATQPASSSEPAKPPAVPEPTSRPGTASVIHKVTGGQAHPTAARGDTMSVAAFLSANLSPGQEVVVRGACLDQFHVRSAAGPPPASRSDWQLVSGEHTVYVVGLAPGECAAGPVAVRATVGVDTISLGTRAQPRRFLVLAVPR